MTALLRWWILVVIAWTIKSSARGFVFAILLLALSLAASVVATEEIDYRQISVLVPRQPLQSGKQFVIKTETHRNRGATKMNKTQRWNSYQFSTCRLRTPKTSHFDFQLNSIPFGHYCFASESLALR